MNKKKNIGRMAGLLAAFKAPRITYLLRHPVKGSRNMLALRGAKSLIMTRGAAVTAAAVATTAVATPLVFKAVRRGERTSSR